MSKKPKLNIQNVKQFCPDDFEINYTRHKNPPVYTSEDVCSSGKVCYQTKASAYNAVKGMSKSRGSVSVYKCSICNNYHTGRNVKKNNKK